jgi:hypothetical protein
MGGQPVSYAINSTATGWRSVNSAADLLPGETFSDTQPVIIVQETIADKLGKLDAENQLTQRNLRETVMLMAEAFKTLSQGALDLSHIPGVAKVYEVEAKAAALRDQL